MKRTYFGACFIALAASAVWFANEKSSINEEALLASNVEALSTAFEFDGTEWTNEGSHMFGTDWCPVLKACTYNSGSWSFGASVGYKGVVEGSATYNTSSYSMPGHLVQCVYGNGNCWNGTSCIPD